MRFFKVAIYNFFIFLFLIIILEVVFGYWFKKENFGIYMRKERKVNWQTTSSFYGKEYNFYYKRNFWGFRGEEFDPKDVMRHKIVSSIVKEYEKRKKNKD